MQAHERKTYSVEIGHAGQKRVALGGGAPVVVQSMTNTDTADAASTANQIAQLARCGSELVRITVNTPKAAEAVPEIKARLFDQGIDVPLVGDFHYNGHVLLPKYPQMAAALAKYRINPGNVGPGRSHDENFRIMIRAAIEHQTAVRIGVNWGSLDQQLLTEMMDENAKRDVPLPTREVMIEAMIASALRSAELARSYDLPAHRIVLSAKVSGVVDLWDVYRRLAARCRYALHLGLTEAGMGPRGIVASTAALTPLLAEGIGDTIRVSLTPEPGAARDLEVQVAQFVLQSLGLRAFAPQVTACPGCGRTTSTLFQHLAQQVEERLAARMPTWRATYPGVERLKVAVMGCIVNGPGESKHADIGISLPGTGETPRAPVFVDGKKTTTLEGETLADDFMALVESYVARRFGS